MSVVLEGGDYSRAAVMVETIRPKLLDNPTRRATYWTGYGWALARVRGRQGDAVIALRRAEKISPGKVRATPFIVRVHPSVTERNGRYGCM